VTFWPWSHITWCQPVWSTPVPSLKWIRFTVPELRRLFSIDRQLKIPLFTFFDKKGQTSGFIILTTKGTYLVGTTYIDAFCVGLCPKMRPVGVMKKGKKTEAFVCKTGYLHRQWRRNKFESGSTRLARSAGIFFLLCLSTFWLYKYN